jgi:hypothetical protein
LERPLWPLFRLSITSAGVCTTSVLGRLDQVGDLGCRGREGSATLARSERHL